MMLSKIFAGLTALATVVGAQSTEDSDSASSSAGSSRTASATSASASAVNTISEGHKFTPQTVNASVGDIIQFRFYPTGHSVVRAEYKYPCIPYEYTGPNKVGFFSGFEDVATITNDGPTFSVRVNDTAPIWFYCAAPGSCIDNWMIGVINPNATQTLDVQLAYTKNTTMQVTPGDPLPSETAAGTAGATATSGSSSGSDSHSHSSSPLSAGAIAGISIGGAVVLLIAATLLYLCGRRGGLDKAYNRQSRHAMAPPPMAEVKYNGSAKSPGQETFATTAYSVTPSNDPYQQQQGHGVSQGVPSYSVHSGSPPPMSVHSQNSYQHFGSAPGMGTPFMQGSENGGLFNVPQRTSTPGAQQQQQQHPQAPPVELPTSMSPMQAYAARRTFSWSTGGDGANRSSKP
ncbi:hypothetical protein J7T55_002113 [Diaporthe amygdali]|uniref:uncharacterized protein n=1 Tax=Phomopsis amygdali TaxID=1214568 RepID=UPI0022FF35D2|nr:uncharacterized protein J7T55_002113 [Diaporthe amygdali]KAJ0108509.1 hypothetical protein J7T55_002113 [Diaporthe amygdali]